MGNEVINLIFMGHYGDETMVAGVGLGNVIMNVLGLSLMIGINSSLETLVAHAVGAGELEMCAVYMNRQRVVIFMICVPLGIVLQYAE